ncbi:4a-hydroxytetrahydrobiopterin dehydratase [Gynuella sp.]|uniref:4a-hydroxytetrahydrobiopterin dehydratase n=1 Tax=Gynuella sp. TaxID=2969146 RepID=UPI003D0E8D3F
MTIQPVSDQHLQAFLNTHPHWTVQNRKLHCQWVFENFVQAFAFMTAVALTAEAANHHPDWSNQYKRVTIDLTTHEAGGISPRDFELAEQIDHIADRFQQEK